MKLLVSCIKTTSKCFSNFNRFRPIISNYTCGETIVEDKRAPNSFVCFGFFILWAELMFLMSNFSSCNRHFMKFTFHVRKQPTESYVDEGKKFTI